MHKSDNKLEFRLVFATEGNLRSDQGLDSVHLQGFPINASYSLLEVRRSLNCDISVFWV